MIGREHAVRLGILAGRNGNDIHSSSSAQTISAEGPNVAGIFGMCDEVCARSNLVQHLSADKSGHRIRNPLRAFGRRGYAEGIMIELLG